jgi:hypothetical protein
MRPVLQLLALAAVLFSAVHAMAENRTYVVSNREQDPLLDCLATATGCRSSVADAYCQVRGFAQAANFAKIEREDITSAVPSRGFEFFRIDCTR